MQHFEGVLSGERERLVQQKQLEIQGMNSEIHQMKLKSELSITNVETASPSNTEELKNTIRRLQNEVNSRKVHRESGIRHYKDLIHQL